MKHQFRSSDRYSKAICLRLNEAKWKINSRTYRTHPIRIRRASIVNLTSSANKCVPFLPGVKPSRPSRRVCGEKRVEKWSFNYTRLPTAAASLFQLSIHAINRWLYFSNFPVPSFNAREAFSRRWLRYFPINKYWPVIDRRTRTFTLRKRERALPWPPPPPASHLFYTLRDGAVAVFFSPLAAAAGFALCRQIICHRVRPQCSPTCARMTLYTRCQVTPIVS